VIEQIVEDVEAQRIGLDFHARKDRGVREHVLDARPFGGGHARGQGGRRGAPRPRDRPEQKPRRKDERAPDGVSQGNVPSTPKPPPGVSASLLAHEITTPNVVGSGPCDTMM